MHDDARHLELLSIFHFVAAAMAAIFGLLPLLQIVLVVVLAAPNALSLGTFENVGACFGFSVLGLIMLLFFISAGGLAAAGLYLRRRTHHTFCMVVAAISCLAFPVGTILGVCTLIVLTRPSVRELFGVATTPRSAEVID